MNWDYLQPVKIYFGKGRVHEIKKIAQELGCASRSASVPRTISPSNG